MRFLILFLALIAPVYGQFLYPVTPPIKLYTDASGRPLNGGRIYFGVANQNPETNPTPMFWDAAGTIPAAQPIRTVNGYISRNGAPANIFSTGDHSVTIRDANGALVFTNPTSTDLQLALSIAGVGAAAAVPIADVGNHYTTDNVEAALQQVGDSGFVTLDRLAAEVLAKLLPTGATIDWPGDPAVQAAPTGWVYGFGRTIGNASSGATERANADTATLFTLLWNNWGNTALPIQDSAGVATTRGASAANDFAANKRLPTPDIRGRVRAGLDFNTGSLASRLTSGGAGITGTTPGATGGTQTHVLTSPGEIPSHAHPMPHTHTINHGHPGSIADPHTHVQKLGSGGATATSGAGAVLGADTNTSTANTNTLTIAAFAGNSGSESTANTSATGSGGAHQNTQPTIIFTPIIKLIVPWDFTGAN